MRLIELQDYMLKIFNKKNEELQTLLKTERYKVSNWMIASLKILLQIYEYNFS